ncbi:MAG: DoxX family protein [Bacteroidota bacterium]
MKDFTDLLGRMMLSFIFLYEAYDSVFFFKETKLKMAIYGLTWNQDLLLYGAIFLLTIGGLMVLSGYRSSLGAFLLMLYWIPVTFIVHDFWNLSKECPVQFTCFDLKGHEFVVQEYYRRTQSILFMKNIAILGGLLVILVNGSGRYSIRRLFATTRVPGA